MKQPGDTVDRYVIEAHLGRGGMGEVYEATDTRLGRRVALKLIPPGADADANQRMLREARAAASFEHPHAVVVYDVGEAEGATFLAMELVPGASLRARIGDASVPVARRLRWLVDVARALGAAHRHSIVHRDVKPDNVMIREDGAAKVLDFGIARRHAAAAVDPSAPTQASSTPLDTLTAAGVIVGTPQYASPEQLRGEPVDGRSDVFSWGVMAYELLSGGMPWRAPDAVTLLAQILSAEPPALAEKAPDVPAEVAEAVTHAMAKKAADRFATIDEAADAVEAFAESAAVPTPGGRAAAVEPTPAATPTRQSVVGRVVRGTGRVVFAIFAIIGGVIVIGLGTAIFIGWRRGTLRFDGPGAPMGQADAGPCTVAALACADARVEGEGATPELAQAIGRAACARVATALGVDWGGGGEGAPLSVDATLSAGSAHVTLGVLGHRAEGAGPTPLDAIADAQKGLLSQLAPPPMDAATIKSWGAADEAGARRVERVWRELLLGVLQNSEAAAKALLASDPGSAWSYLVAALVRPRLTPESKATVARGLELVDALPPARAHALRATLVILGATDADAGKEAIRLLRLAYTEAPDDGDVAGLYAAVANAMGYAAEGDPVLDRLSARFPTKSVLALRNSLSVGLHDMEREGRYVDRMRAILPEAWAWEESVRYLGDAGRFDDARAALAFGRRLGLSGMSVDPVMLELTGAWVELAAGEPAAARGIAARVLADPRLAISSAGAQYTIASYLLEGRLGDAEAAELHELDRQRAVGTQATVAGSALRVARLRRLFGRPPPDAEIVAAVDAFVASFPNPRGVAPLAAEAALAHAALAPKGKKALLADALDKLRAQADKERERAAHDGLRLAALPLERAVSGDAAAARTWLEADRASFRSRRTAALEAALALEAAGKRAEAAAAYALAMDAFEIEDHALDAGVARARLAALRRAEGRKEEADKLDAAVDRLWAKADPGLREAVKKMR